MKTAWTRLALQDLDSAYEFICEDNPSAAAGLIEQIQGSVAMIARHPGLGRPGRIEGTRELVVAGTPFVIPYRVKGDRIEVLAVLHAARRWPESF